MMRSARRRMPQILRFDCVNWPQKVFPESFMQLTQEKEQAIWSLHGPSPVPEDLTPVCSQPYRAAIWYVPLPGREIRGCGAIEVNRSGWNLCGIGNQP